MISPVEPPGKGVRTFLNFPLCTDLGALAAQFAILGVPRGMPYHGQTEPNNQSLAPDALRACSSDEDVRYTLEHYDFDLGGHLLAGKDVRIVDCGNALCPEGDVAAHYQNAEQAARAVYSAGAALIGIGGDHGVTIPLIRALEILNRPVTLVHVDAHLDWRDDIEGERHGYSSPIRRASEMPWIKHITQIGMRGIGSARQREVNAAQAWGADIITAYQLQEMGMQQVLERIPDGGPYYLSIDADGVDPSLMPAVLAPTPGGLLWHDLHQLIHGLVQKGPVVGMDLVEIAPSHDVRQLTLVNAERVICNFIGASVRAGH